MAVYITAIPTLQGSTAERFVKISEDNLIKRKFVDFTKSADKEFLVLIIEIVALHLKFIML